MLKQWLTILFLFWCLLFQHLPASWNDILKVSSVPCIPFSSNMFHRNQILLCLSLHLALVSSRPAAWITLSTFLISHWWWISSFPHEQGCHPCTLQFLQVLLVFQSFSFGNSQFSAVRQSPYICLCSLIGQLTALIEACPLVNQVSSWHEIVVELAVFVSNGVTAARQRLSKLEESSKCGDKCILHLPEFERWVRCILRVLPYPKIHCGSYRRFFW